MKAEIKNYIPSILVLLSACTSAPEDKMSKPPEDGPVPSVQIEPNSQKAKLSSPPGWVVDVSKVGICRTLSLAERSAEAERTALLRASEKLNAQRDIWKKSICEMQAHQDRAKSELSCDSMSISNEELQIVEKWVDQEKNLLYLLVEDRLCQQEIGESS